MERLGRNKFRIIRKWLAEHPKVIAGFLLIVVLAIISAFFCFVVSDKPMDIEGFFLCLIIEIGVVGGIIWMMNK